MAKLNNVSVRNFLLILSVVMAPLRGAEGQGVFKVRFADLAIVDTRYEVASGAVDQGDLCRSHQNSSLEIAIENQGDLPARDEHVRIRLYLMDQISDPPLREVSVAAWDQYGVSYLAGQRPPSPPYLHSMQSGVLIAKSLDLSGVCNPRALQVCIEFLDGLPFGEDERNNCAAIKL